MEGVGMARKWLRALRGSATAWVLLFGVQLAYAASADYAPVTGIGRVLYPHYIGRNPWTPENLVINLSIVFAALGAFYFADKLERDGFFVHRTMGWTMGSRHTTRFSQ
jgi:hypothetical protein